MNKGWVIANKKLNMTVFPDPKAMSSVCLFCHPVLSNSQHKVTMTRKQKLFCL